MRGTSRRGGGRVVLSYREKVGCAPMDGEAGACDWWLTTAYLDT